MDRVQAPKAIVLIEEMTLACWSECGLAKGESRVGGETPGYRFSGWYGVSGMRLAAVARSRAALLTMQLPLRFGLLVTCICCSTDVCLEGHDWMLGIAEAHSDGTLSIGHGWVAAFVTAVMFCRLGHSRRKFLCCRVGCLLTCAVGT